MNLRILLFSILLCVPIIAKPPKISIPKSFKLQIAIKEPIYVSAKIEIVFCCVFSKFYFSGVTKIW